MLRKKRVDSILGNFKRTIKELNELVKTNDAKAIKANRKRIKLKDKITELNKESKLAIKASQNLSALVEDGLEAQENI